MFQVMKATHVEDLINDPNFNIDNYYGYVYMTTNLENGRQYIGKKIFKHTTNQKLGKKEIAALPTHRLSPLPQGMIPMKQCSPV